MKSVVIGCPETGTVTVKHYNQSGICTWIQVTHNCSYDQYLAIKLAEYRKTHELMPISLLIRK